MNNVESLKSKRNIEDINRGISKSKISSPPTINIASIKKIIEDNAANLKSHVDGGFNDQQQFILKSLKSIDDQQFTKRIQVKKSISAPPKLNSILTGRTKLTIKNLSAMVKSEQNTNDKYSAIDSQSITRLDIFDNESIKLSETKKLRLAKKIIPTKYFAIIFGDKLEKFIEDYYSMKKSSKQQMYFAVQKFFRHVRTQNIDYFSTTTQCKTYLNSDSKIRQSKTTASHLKSFSKIIDGIDCYKFKFKEADFQYLFQMKGIKKQVNPHTYWPREVIWLFIVYLYDRFISTNSKSNELLQLALVIELLYSFCLRRGELINVSLQDLVDEKQIVTLKGGSTKELTCSKIFKQSLQQRIKLIGINANSSLVDDKVINKLNYLFSSKKYEANKEMLEFVNNCLSAKYKQECFPTAHYQEINDSGNKSNRHFQSHDLRKSYICEMYKDGCEVEAIKLRASHKKVAVTINSYIEGHRKGYLDQKRDHTPSKKLPNITVNQFPYFVQQGLKIKLMTDINDGFNLKVFTKHYHTTIKNIEDNLIERLQKLNNGSKIIRGPKKRQKLE